MLQEMLLQSLEAFELRDPVFQAAHPLLQRLAVIICRLFNKGTPLTHPVSAIKRFSIDKTTVSVLQGRMQERDGSLPLLITRPQRVVLESARVLPLCLLRLGA
jgi:hypothetical protein